VHPYANVSLQIRQINDKLHTFKEQTVDNNTVKKV